MAKRKGHKPGLRSGQKAALHRYAGLAGLSTAKGDRWEYEVLLREQTEAGCTSAADPKFTMADFACVMYHLEAMAEQRVLAGELVKPEWIDITYWRRKFSREIMGGLNSRQHKLIEDLWEQLQKLLVVESQRDRGYLMGLVRQVLQDDDTEEISALSEGEARLVINMLRARIRQTWKEVSDG